MVRKVEKRFTNSSCIALNYEIFQDLYDIDLRRSGSELLAESADDNKQPLPF